MADENPDFKYIVRVANADLDGNDRVEVALSNIKGFGVRTGIVLVNRAGIPKGMKAGDLSDEQVAKLNELVGEAVNILPKWMLNRQQDRDTGEDLHVYGPDLDLKKRDDLNRLKKIQSYRGVRHATGQKVRGQRSKSNGRTGLTLGVTKKK